MIIFRNILAVVLGWIVGSAVNMGLVSINGKIIPYPEGFSMDRFIETAHLLEPINMIVPFFAHALGTLVGAFLAAKIAGSRPKLMAIMVGVIFLTGGAYMTTLIDQPIWFTAIDLLLAYIPMGWLGWKLSGRKDSLTKA